MDWRRGSCIAAIALAALVSGCRGDERDEPVSSETLPASVEAGTSANSTATADDRAVIVFLGTSLTAGLGLPVEQSYPMIIQRELDDRGLPYRVVNAGVSGETSAGAVRRIDWLLAQPFGILVIETGANDMLQGTSPEALEENLQTIIDRTRAARPDAKIILAGMLAMPNLGPQYVAEFEKVYPRVAERNDLPLIPFLLDGVAGDPTMNLADGIHPNPAGHRKVADTVMETLMGELER
jgi:acyl-CoA thioesterase-1